MAMFPENIQPFLLPGHRGMTLPTIEDPFPLMGLLYIIYRRHRTQVLSCVAEKTEAGGWQPYFSIPA